ncbi:MAG: ECF-type sigma factor [Verrucomicrobiae bacterium]|nr:ECF-type sigma factor [Verrucomicrobiae bacterium]
MLEKQELDDPQGLSDDCEITRLLNRQVGQAFPAEQLLPLVYAELRALAAARMARESPGQTLQATALVHEAWMRLANSSSKQWENRGHFFSAAAEAMRRILIENARRKSRLKHGGGQIRVDFEGLDLAAASPDDQVLLLDDALVQLQSLDPQKARIVVMKFFGGMSGAEIAGVLGITERTVERQWAYAKAWLFNEIRKAAQT